MLKLRCFAIAGIILMGSTAVLATELGYRTEGYPAINVDTDQLSNGGNHRFTRPAYSSASPANRSYYRSYHAHKDAVLSGAYTYDAPWAWAYHGAGYPIPYHTFPMHSLETTAAPAPTRQLLKTRDGQCFEVQRNSKGEELRTELGAEDCNW